MNIKGESVSQYDVRCQQCGDWQYDNDKIEIKSVRMADWRYELLVQVHELVEAALCKHRGITDQIVTDFDAQFEMEREKGLHSETAEDGDDPRSPYRAEHFFASNIERLLAAELDVDWNRYEQAILNATTEYAPLAFKEQV